MAGIVVVFDFDRTLIDGDSDSWVVDELGAGDLFRRLMHTLPWNSLMDRMMKELHSRGKTVADIEDCLRRAPLDAHIIGAIKSAHGLGCDLRVVSDANLFFIETVLKHHGIMECFSEIVSNPTDVDEDGRLRISPYHDSNAAPHGCHLCPPNLCKGKVIERIQESIFVDGKKQFIYLGDGKGDYCPSLRLTEGDYVMPKKGYSLWKLITDNTQLLKAEIHEWRNGKELKTILLHLINGLISATVSKSVRLDCKLAETIPMASNEACPVHR